MSRIKWKKVGIGCGITFLILLVIAFAVGAILVQYGKEQIDKVQRESYAMPYQDTVILYCEAYDVDPLFIYAMMKQESGFQPNAVSIDDARGLLQLTEPTYDWVKFKLKAQGEQNLGENGTFDDMFDPETNIRYAVWLTAYLFEQFGNTETVLTAYHAGLNITKEWLKTPEYSADGITLQAIPYDDTRYHVNKVMGYYEKYQELYSEELS